MDFIHTYKRRFKDAGSSLSFINVDFFLKRLWNPEDRLKIQPAFVLSGLAMATLMKSSECENRAPGRDRALWLRNAAQGALEQALASEWVDASLAEAALVSHIAGIAGRSSSHVYLDARLVRILGTSSI